MRKLPFPILFSINGHVGGSGFDDIMRLTSSVLPPPLPPLVATPPRLRLRLPSDDERRVLDGAPWRKSEVSPALGFGVLERWLLPRDVITLEPARDVTLLPVLLLLLLLRARRLRSSAFECDVTTDRSSAAGPLGVALLCSVKTRVFDDEF